MRCRKTMESLAIPSHTHTCSGNHDAGYHWCPECQQWWWKKEAQPTSKGTQ